MSSGLFLILWWFVVYLYLLFIFFFQYWANSYPLCSTLLCVSLLLQSHGVLNCLFLLFLLVNSLSDYPISTCYLCQFYVIDLSYILYYTDFIFRLFWMSFGRCITYISSNFRLSITLCLHAKSIRKGPDSRFTYLNSGPSCCETAVLTTFLLMSVPNNVVKNRPTHFCLWQVSIKSIKTFCPEFSWLSRHLGMPPQQNCLSP